MTQEKAYNNSVFYSTEDIQLMCSTSRWCGTGEGSITSGQISSLPSTSWWNFTQTTLSPNRVKYSYKWSNNNSKETVYHLPPFLAPPRHSSAYLHLHHDSKKPPPRCRSELCTVSTPKRRTSWASKPAISSGSWSAPTRPGGKANCGAKQACSPPTTPIPSERNTHQQTHATIQKLWIQTTSNKKFSDRRFQLSRIKLTCWFRHMNILYCTQGFCFSSWQTYCSCPGLFWQ